AGDYTYTGSSKAKHKFFGWFLSQPFKHKVLIAGNHDFDEPYSPVTLGSESYYLCDSGLTIDGFRFWGSPWTPKFGDWEFMYARGTDRWKTIPEGTDVLVTHGPPESILDKPFGINPSVGCKDLADRVFHIKPKVHVFGHIHGSYGVKDFNGTTFVNASSVNESYKIQNSPVVVDLYQ